jgi:glutathione S-transferase
VEFVQKRLSALSRSLGDKPYLDGDRFTAGDLMMTPKSDVCVTSVKLLIADSKRTFSYVRSGPKADKRGCGWIVR